MNIYKTVVRSILMYAIEMRANTKRTKQKLNNIEMKIRGVSLKDKHRHITLQEMETERARIDNKQGNKRLQGTQLKRESEC